MLYLSIAINIIKKGMYSVEILNFLLNLFLPGQKDTRNFVMRPYLHVRAPINAMRLIFYAQFTRTRKLIARNAHAITRCACVKAHV